MGFRADAHHRAHGRAAGEQDHRRDREDVVARADAGVVVDVQPRDGNGRLELRENRLQRLARAAPRGPEVDEQRAAGDRIVETGGVELAHQNSPRNAANRSAGTCVIASSTIVRLIFDCPAVRSAKTMGTSTTSKPARIARYVVSIWNA